MTCSLNQPRSLIFAVAPAAAFLLPQPNSAGVLPVDELVRLPLVLSQYAWSPTENAAVFNSRQLKHTRHFNRSTSFIRNIHKCYPNP